MKLNLKIAQKTISSGDLAVSKMDVDAESADILQYYLRDKIYTDKILAPIREYICNATDSHIEFGIDRDVEVSLGMENGSLMWKCRDYGEGMDDDDIRNVFGKYGKSSKRDSEKQIGGFGVGALSGFSYIDTFYVVSHHKGVKTSYVCTLGSGNFGVSVGEIYEVGKEPTDEQGIEISFEVEEKDRFSFNNTTAKLVQGFMPITKIKFVYNVAGAFETTVPLQPFNTVKVGDYTISNYESFPYPNGYRQYFMIRMGGVVYPYAYIPTNVPRISYPIVVDVPIEKLSIPISRESIEDLPQNKKVFDEIKDILNKIGNEEVSNLIAPKFGNVISKNEGFGQDYNGTWFRYPYSQTFPKTYEQYYNVNRCDGMQGGYTSNASTVIGIGDNKKYNVYVFPDIKSLSSWHLRLTIHLKELATAKSKKFDGYLWIRSNKYDELIAIDDPSIDISDCNFIDIKTMKLKPLEKNSKDAKSANTHFMCYGNEYNKHQVAGGYYTAEELNNAIIKKAYGGKVPAKNWHEKVTSLQDLHIRTISTRKGNTWNHMTVNSVVMIENLIKLGWVSEDCKEYKDAVTRLNSVAERENVIRSIEYRSQYYIFSTPMSKRTVEALKKKPSRLQLLDKVKQNIINEDSLRGKVLKTFISEYNRNLTREDIRKIMKLK